MRNLIFFILTVSLVSLSMCQTQQNTQQDVKPTKQVLLPTTVHDEKQASVDPKKQEATNTQANGKNETATNIVAPQIPGQDKMQPTPQVDQKNATAQNNTESKTNGTTETIDNKTDKGVTEKQEAVTPITGEQVEPTKITLSNETKIDDKANKTQNATTPDEKSNAVVPTNETVKPTEAHEAKQVLQTRAFDGASFVGGIVLTLGLLAISFVGFKYYKNLTKENYHIL